MSKFCLEIETDNAAFEDEQEVARILTIVSGKISSGQESGSCFDSNGNNVGSFELTSDLAWD